MKNNKNIKHLISIIQTSSYLLNASTKWDTNLIGARYLNDTMLYLQKETKKLKRF